MIISHMFSIKLVNTLLIIHTNDLEPVEYPTAHTGPYNLPQTLKILILRVFVTPHVHFNTRKLHISFSGPNYREFSIQTSAARVSSPPTPSHTPRCPRTTL